MARERRRSRPPRVTLRQIKADAAKAAQSGKRAASKADIFMDWLTAQAEELDDMLEHPRELGGYLREIAEGFFDVPDDTPEPDDGGKASIVSRVWRVASLLFRYREREDD